MNLPNCPLPKSAFFAALFLVLNIACFSQKPIPSWVEEIKPEIDLDIKTKDVNDGYFVLLYCEEWNVPSQEVYYHYARKIVSEAGLKSASQIEVSYDPSYEKAEINYIRVIRNGKTIDRSKSKVRLLEEEKDRSSGILSNKKTLFVNLEDIHINDIVEFAYTFKGFNPVYKGTHCSFNYLGTNEPCGRAFVKFIFPKSLPVQYKLFNTSTQPAIAESANVKAYTWNIHLPAVTKLEEKFPVWFIPYPYVVFTSFKSWKELKAFNSEVVNKEKNKSDKLKHIIDTVVANHPEKEEQFTVLVDFVQNHIRYTGNEDGIYGYTARAPNDVLQRFYGDCKDKSLLLSELLKGIGYEAYPALVSTDYKGHVKSFDPCHFWFNHCIVAVKSKNGSYSFIDPTITMQKGPASSRSVPNYGTAMVLDSDSSSVFHNFSEDKRCKTEITERFDIDEESGNATLKVTTAYYGLDADDIRYYFRDNSLADIQVNYKNFYNKISGDIHVLDTIRYQDDHQQNKVVVKEKYLLKGFWAVEDSSTKKIEKSFLPYSLNEKVLYVDTKERKFPLSIYHPVNISQRLEIVIPGGWNVDNAHKTKRTDFFDYDFTTTVTGDMLVLDYKFVTKKSFVSPAEYPAYKKATDFIDENIVFSSEKTITGEDYSISCNYLYIICMVASIAFCITLCMYLSRKKINTTYETRYPGVNGWLVLVVIGLILSPLAYLVTMIKDLSDNFNIDYYKYYFSNDSDPTLYLQGIFELAIIFFNYASVVFYVFLAIICLQRKNTFRIYYVAFKAFGIVFLLLNIIYLKWLNSTNFSADYELLISKQQVTLIRMFVQFLIWGSYVWFSERSRHTFTVGNESPDNTEAVLSDIVPVKLN